MLEWWGFVSLFYNFTPRFVAQVCRPRSCSRPSLSRPRSLSLALALARSLALSLSRSLTRCLTHTCSRILPSPLRLPLSHSPFLTLLLWFAHSLAGLQIPRELGKLYNKLAGKAGMPAAAPRAQVDEVLNPKLETLTNP